MPRIIAPLAAAVLAVVATMTVTTMSSRATEIGYAEDRAAIEDLQARYLFAMDFHDPDLYVQTFTEDGILDIGSGEIRGREAIREVIARMPNPPAPPAESGLWQAVGRHNISNIVVRIDGDRATGRAYWFHYTNDTPTRSAVFDGFGHYEDELVRIDGQWLFSKRRIYNENRDEWAYKGSGNPAW